MKTVACASVHEIEKIKGSRFIGLVFPLNHTHQKDGLLSGVRARFPDARHVCWAYRGRDEDDYRWSDDGEPSGTAGPPIYRVLHGLGLTQTLAVVVRYFGGIKLGTGGLARAYSLATKELLERATLCRLIEKVDLEFRVSYSFEASLKHLLGEHGAGDLRCFYEDEVRVQVTLPSERVEQVILRVTERTAGRARIESSPVYWG